jgi:hypothetical protein
MHLIKFLEYSMAVGEIAEAASEEDRYKQVNKQVELFKKITKEITPSVEHDPVNPTEKHHSRDFEQNIGPALRALQNFLKEADPNQYWDGLQKVVTEDGNIFWLCEEHARPYQVRPLQL